MTVFAGRTKRVSQPITDYPVLARPITCEETVDISNNRKLGATVAYTDTHDNRVIKTG